MDKKYTIAVAGTGYVGLSIATLLSQHHKVYAVDIVPAKVDMVNQRKSPIQDEYIEKYLAEKDLDLTATLDAEMVYSAADFVVIAAPTNGDDKCMFCAVRANGLFMTYNEWRELNWVIYTVLTKLMHRQGSIQQSNT